LEALLILSLFVCVFGCVGVILHNDYLNKIIMFAFLEGGIIGLIVSMYYLDIAIVSSILEPIGTIVLLLGALKYTYLKKSKKRYGNKIPILSK